MRAPRLHLDAPLAAGALLELPRQQARHAIRVLRLREGAALTVFDGHGAEHAALIASIAGGRVEVRVGAPAGTAPDSPLALTLAQGLARGERMDLVVQKATELGVHAVQPLATVRGGVHLDQDRAARRRDHWQAVAAAACEQCGRARVPEVAAVCGLGEWLGTAATAFDTRVVLAPEGSRSLADTPVPRAAACMLVGPEGGLDDDELAAAAAAGFVPVRLGPRTLRTETAALAAVALAQAAWGDLG